MPDLMPFRALRYRNPAERLFIPGEGPEPAFVAHEIESDSEPALFIYRQRFHTEGHECVRKGVVGLVNRDEARIYPHEETNPETVRACAVALAARQVETSAIWLWCNDDGFLAPLLERRESLYIEAVDHHGCLHQIERMTDPTRIDAVQTALRGRPFFIADGHHRFASGWNLAAIQVRTAALRTNAAHRLITAGDPDLSAARPIDDLIAYQSSAPPGFVRFGVVTEDGLRGLELPRSPDERAMSALRAHLSGGIALTPMRGGANAIEAVRAGLGRYALLLEPLDIDDIEIDALAGRLFPPKSTDFYPKLAGGLIMSAHVRK